MKPLSSSAYVIEVVGGNDHGLRLELDERVRTIGRSRDSDLVLRDLGVSRHHVQVSSTERGVQFVACGGASAFLVDGRPLRAFDAQVGDRVLVGNTLIVVSSGAPAGPRAGSSHTDVRTVLTGVGADAHAMASVYGLIEALDVAQDNAALEVALAAWAATLVPACTMEIRRGPDAEPSSAGVAERQDGGRTLIVVPAPADEPVSLAFTCDAVGDNVTDAYRRMVVVAGRLYGSSLARTHRAEVADGEVAQLRALSYGTARDFLGTSPGALHLAERIPRLAASDVSVLFDGETGVGKSFVARLVHEASPRAKEPLRVINCAAIPETLFESELFGHERGAFTGATGTRIGAMEAAGSGTLLLDEVGELSLASQAKLLRVVEERRFERVGSNREIKLRARILCATNRDLERMAQAGDFRKDLLFRIAVVRVQVPSLRDRVEDLPALASQLLADAAASAGRRVNKFSKEAMAAICRYAWPGNVRELRNAVEHAVALGEGPVVNVQDLPPGLIARAEQPENQDLVQLPADLASLERRAILSALRATADNRLRAAALLGIPRSTLYLKLKEHKVG